MNGVQKLALRTLLRIAYLDDMQAVWVVGSVLADAENAGGQGRGATRQAFACRVMS